MCVSPLSQGIVFSEGDGVDVWLGGGLCLFSCTSVLAKRGWAPRVITSRYCGQITYYYYYLWRLIEACWREELNVSC